jgi:hypothetical protein
LIRPFKPDAASAALSRSLSEAAAVAARVPAVRWRKAVRRGIRLFIEWKIAVAQY